MKTARRVLFSGLCLATVSAAHAGLLDWQLNGRGGQVVSGLRLTLWNITDKENLRYGSRTWGINLVWDKTPNLHNVQVFSRGTAGRPINYGQRVALYIKGGGYLKHEKRTVGINLGWSSTPKYEWEIGGTGGDPGQPIKQGDHLCLFNIVANDFVIYDNRRAGINLVWAKDEGTKSWSALFRDIGKVLQKPSKAMTEWISSRGS